MISINPAKLAQKLARARSAMGHAILYTLGAGGQNPNSPTPADGSNHCDCSGFALAWVQGISRQQEGKGKPWEHSIPWVNTDAVVADAKGKQQLFVRLMVPVAGCAMVYGAKGGECGHCAIVSGFSLSNGKVVSVRGIDCHGGYSGHHVNAIEEHDLSYFLAKGCIFVVLREDLN